MPRKWVPADPGHWQRRYLAGESEYALAAQAGVSTGAFARFLVAAGIPRRSCREANTLRMARMTAAERQANTAAAHTASRGHSRSQESLAATAVTRQRIGFGIGRWEHAVARELAARGLQVIAQLPVRGYNIDIAVWPLAVEIHSGAGHPHESRYRERIEYLADRGWHQVYVTFRHGRFDVQAVCDHVVTLLDDSGFRSPAGRPPGQAGLAPRHTSGVTPA